MRKQLVTSVILAFLGVIFVQCSTFESISNAQDDPENSPIVYGGVRTNLTEHNDEGCFKGLYAVDLGMSMIVDTVLLPMTIPWALTAKKSGNYGDPEDPYKDDPNEIAILKHALRDDDSAGVREAIEKGADPNKPFVDGYAPIHYAASHCSPNAAKALLEAGADPYARKVNSSIETPLERARLSKCKSVEDLLLSRMN